MRSDRRRSSGCCCTWKRATGWHDQQCHVCSLQRRWESAKHSSLCLCCHESGLHRIWSAECFERGTSNQRICPHTCRHCCHSGSCRSQWSCFWKSIQADRQIPDKRGSRPSGQGIWTYHERRRRAWLSSCSCISKACWNRWTGCDQQSCGCK